MRIKDIIKTLGEGKGKETIYDIIDTISCFLEDRLSEEDYCSLCKIVYSKLARGHFNREFADLQISKMYYTEKGEKQYAPYWSETEAYGIYEKYKSEIPNEYNFYDFEVVLNMIKSDHHDIVEKWFGEEDSEDKYIELAINWLNDDDNPYGSEKAWGYFNGK